jgi:mitochondrial fission protein ELM1
VTGRPVLVFQPSWRVPGGPRNHALIKGLQQKGIVQPFSGRLELSSYEPLNSTPIIAEAIASAYLRRRHAFGLA